MQLLANQFALGPLTLVTSFAWNYTLLNKQSQLVGKLQRDGLPTLQNGVPLPCVFPIPFQLSVSLFSIPRIFKLSAQKNNFSKGCHGAAPVTSNGRSTPILLGSEAFQRCRLMSLFHHSFPCPRWGLVFSIAHWAPPCPADAQPG